MKLALALALSGRQRSPDDHSSAQCRVLRRELRRLRHRVHDADGRRTKDRKIFSRPNGHVGYGDEVATGDRAVVRSKVVARHGDAVALDYYMMRTPVGRRAYDVLVDGVSLIASYRAQFDRIIRASSYNDLVRTLQTKQSE